jgi:hypothetical protein
MSRPEAIRYSFQTVGVAIISTTLIISVGFAVLTSSSFLVNNQMGLLTAITIVFALIFDFLFLPALLMLGYRAETASVQPEHSSGARTTLAPTTSPQ